MSLVEACVVSPRSCQHSCNLKLHTTQSPGMHFKIYTELHLVSYFQIRSNEMHNNIPKEIIAHPKRKSLSCYSKDLWLPWNTNWNLTNDHCNDSMIALGKIWHNTYWAQAIFNKSADAYQKIWKLFLLTIFFFSQFGLFSQELWVYISQLWFFVSATEKN